MTYGMLIDLKKCIGCHACAVACKEAHGTPPKVTRAHVEIEYVGNYPDVRMTAYPMLCMHCENAPCVEVCPTGASFKREDGIVAINKGRVHRLQVVHERLPLRSSLLPRGRERVFW